MTITDPGPKATNFLKSELQLLIKATRAAVESGSAAGVRSGRTKQPESPWEATFGEPLTRQPCPMASRNTLP
jgi:hypothetical protein